jgi:hypothetical protein
MSAASAIDWSAVADSVLAPSQALVYKIKTATTFEEFNDETYKEIFNEFSRLFKTCRTGKDQTKMDLFWEVYSTVNSLSGDWARMSMKESDAMALKDHAAMTVWMLKEIPRTIDRLPDDAKPLFSSIVEEFEALVRTPLESILLVKNTSSLRTAFEAVL